MMSREESSPPSETVQDTGGSTDRPFISQIACQRWYICRNVEVLER